MRAWLPGSAPPAVLPATRQASFTDAGGSGAHIQGPSPSKHLWGSKSMGPNRGRGSGTSMKDRKRILRWPARAGELRLTHLGNQVRVLS